MSGICGIVSLDGHDPSAHQIRVLVAPLQRRGPDRTSTWLSGPAAFGHTLLATTPEAEVEVLPLTLSGCTITADARIDNRAELIGHLAMAEEPRVVGDGELILRAYLLWGEHCLDRLLGDFAFAIWDSRFKRLFCGRDHMGMRQLTYCHVRGRAFVFATEPGPILLHPAPPRLINTGRIADYLHQTEGDLEGIDLTSTFFQDVFRLPPAHSLTLDERGLAVKRYWQLEPRTELKLGSDEAYGQAFLEVFTEAVRCRLRSPGPVGSMLSGGVDSGSIVAVASRLLADEGTGPLHTFSAVGPDPENCIETRTIHAALTMPGIKPYLINHADLDGVRNDLIRLTEQIDEPFDGHSTLNRAVYLTAARSGMKVVLDGAGGDVALTSGNCIVRHLRRGNIAQAWREARGEERFWGVPPSWKAMLTAAWVAWVPPTLRNFRRKLIQRARDSNLPKEPLIPPELAEKVDLAARRRRHRENGRVGDLPDALQRAHVIRGPDMVVARERYDRVASALPIEPRDPFMDIRLLQLCLSIPWAQIQADGWPKMLLRRAMADLLPDSVRWRRGKQHLGWNFTEALLEDWTGWCEQLHRERELLAELVGLNFRYEGKGLGGVDKPNSVRLWFLVSWARRARHSYSATLGGHTDG